MLRVSLTFVCLWEFKDYPYLKVTKCKKIINTKKGKLLNYTSRGYYINGNYYKKCDLNKMIQKIKPVECPF